MSTALGHGRQRSRARRLAVVGLAGAGSAAGALCLSAALVDPLLGTGDEVAHLDYAVSLWRGFLPDFYEGVQFRPPVTAIPPVQWVAQHPPLYYLLVAPLAGPAADRGAWIEATLLGRGVSSLLAVVACLVVAWTAAQLVPRRRAFHAVAAATTVACLAPFTLLGAVVYTDMLGIVVSAAALGVGARLLRRGVTRGATVAAWGLGVAAMATRGMLATTVVVLCAALVLGSLLHRPPGRGLLPALGAGTVRALVLVLLTVAANGWFYLRNIRIFGTWSGGDQDWATANLGTFPRPVGEVARDPAFWSVYLRFFAVRREQLPVLLGVLLVVLALLLVWAAVRGLRRRPYRLDDAAVLAMLLGAAGATVTVQLLYTSGGGGAQWRYVMPALVPLVMAMVVAADAWRWPRGLLPALVPLVLLGSSPVTSRLVQVLAGREEAASPVPQAVLWLLAAVALAGAAAAVATVVVLARAPAGTDARPAAPVAGA